MIDTNILYFIIEEKDRLSRDVREIVYNYENTLYISVESVKELVVAHRHKNLLVHRWKTAKDLVEAITKEADVDILPIDFNVVHTMSQLQINEAEKHYDPSDHIIIAHAITMGMPLISSDKKFPFYREQGLDLVANF